MFGNFNVEKANKQIEKVEYQLQDDSRYKSVNSSQVIVIDTPLGRVYINGDSYFSSVPESAWNAAFSGEQSPKQFLEEKIGSELTDQDISAFQQLLDDLIKAEFGSKDQPAN